MIEIPITKFNWCIETTGGYCFTKIVQEGKESDKFNQVSYWVDEHQDMEFSTMQDVIEYLTDISGDVIIIREI